MVDDDWVQVTKEQLDEIKKELLKDGAEKIK